jgi:hypothetical protein
MNFFRRASLAARKVPLVETKELPEKILEEKSADAAWVPVKGVTVKPVVLLLL